MRDLKTMIAVLVALVVVIFAFYFSFPQAEEETYPAIEEGSYSDPNAVPPLDADINPPQNIGEELGPQ